MKQIKIIASGKHLPEKRVENQELEKKFNLDSDYIEKRTGIKVRYYTEKETIGYGLAESAQSFEVAYISNIKIEDMKKIDNLG